MPHATRSLLILAALSLLDACAGPRSSSVSHASPQPLPPGQVALSQSAQREIGLAIGTVQSRAILATLAAPGKLALIPDREARVCAPVIGRTLRVFARQGDRVEPGTPLAVLDCPELGQAESDFLQADAQLKLKRAASARQEALYRHAFAAGKDLLQARGDEAAAAIEFERASNQLRLLGLDRVAIARLAESRRLDATLTLTAPIRGTLTSRTPALGETFQPGDPLFTIDDTRRLWALADLHEEDLGRVAPGAPVSLTALAFPGAHFVGSVQSIGESLSPDTHLAEARIAVDNPQERLMPGMYVETRIAARAPVKGPSIPATAAILEGTQRVCYVQLGPERFERRAIAVGPEANGFIAVESGLAVGDRVVTRGALLMGAQGAGG